MFLWFTVNSIQENNLAGTFIVQTVMSADDDGACDVIGLLYVLLFHNAFVYTR